MPNLPNYGWWISETIYEDQIIYNIQTTCINTSNGQIHNTPSPNRTQAISWSHDDPISLHIFVTELQCKVVFIYAVICDTCSGHKVVQLRKSHLLALITFKLLWLWHLRARNHGFCCSFRLFYKAYLRKFAISYNRQKKVCLPSSVTFACDPGLLPLVKKTIFLKSGTCISIPSVCFTKVHFR